MTYKLVLENLKHRPLRTFLSTLLIAVPVTLILTLVGLSHGLIEDSKHRQRGVGADVLVRPPGTSLLSLSGAPMPEKLADKMRQEPHVTKATGVIVHVIGGINSITGVDMKSFNEMSGGFRFLEGTSFQNPNDIIIDEYYARQKNVRAGDTIELLNRNWRVAGIFEQGKLARVILPLHVLQDLTGNTGKISQIYLAVDQPANAPGVIASLRAKLADYQIYSMEEFTSLLSINNVPGLSAFISVIIGIAIIIGFAVVFLSMYTAVLQRTREIGILKSLGASRAYVLELIAAEAAVLGISGSLLGIVLSFGARSLIQRLVPASLAVAVVPEWWLISGGIALFGALLGAVYPGLSAARQDPIEALAYE